MGAVPGLGEHTDAVLGELGLSADELGPAAGRRCDRAGVLVTEEQVLLSADRDGVRTLTLNRPDRKNAINAQLWMELADALRAAARDRPACLGDHRRGWRVLLGCGHLHTGGHPPKAQAAQADRCRAGIARTDRAHHCEGDGRGGRRGLESRPRLRFRGRDARIAVLPDLFEARTVGRPGWLVAVAQAGRTSTGQAAGAARRDDRRRRGAGRWAWSPGSSRPTRSTRSSRIWPGRLAAGPPVALAQSKGLLNDGANATLREALANEARAQPGNFATADSTEAYAAFAEKRDPAFTGRWAVPPRSE